MKPVKEWLEELPEEVKQRALKNTSKNKLFTLKPRLSSAIDYAMCWSHTPEGGDYWSGIHKQVKEKEYEALRIAPKPPTEEPDLSDF